MIAMLLAGGQGSRLGVLTLVYDEYGYQPADKLLFNGTLGTLISIF